ncbi:hypothetical protein EDC94DRAFT_591525 [Helicostylum pulchrum]|nr:hypothetical protein EDC94DRAFT_591525 [Helicostylum pulchrum]
MNHPKLLRGDIGFFFCRQDFNIIFINIFIFITICVAFINIIFIIGAGLFRTHNFQYALFQSKQDLSRRKLRTRKSILHYLQYLWRLFSYTPLVVHMSLKVSILHVTIGG